ncbi:MAG: phosphoenolpyruvate--protein phosphotransferase [Verrucomicrobia bacterium]|nr:phosphoenolpyruvate--protein phosphotransferase [Verrucomicrobiota bacterium]MBV9673462.1 phosphoenolpyruvate--protein phosphotransferase [Verrucomicrobiota bacterium]
MSGPEVRFQGVGVAPGIARGAVFIYHPDDEEPPKRRIDSSEIANEIARFETALIATRAQILEMQQRIAEAIGAKDASIFDAHLLVVEDRTLIDEVLRTLERNSFNVEFIFAEVANRYAHTLSQIDDPYLRERAFDIHDVTRRVLRNLSGRSPQTLASIASPYVIVAHNITPSDTATLNRQWVLAFATDVGSRTSHTAIMARSLNIPAVVGLGDMSSRLRPGDHVLLDGTNGLVIQNPTDETLWEYGEVEVRLEKVEQGLIGLRETASTTADGKHIILSANIELPDDVSSVVSAGAEGIGLYRTEFFFLNKTELPNEEEQFHAYRAVATGIAPQTVIIRTLDLGGDKFLSHSHLPTELNPFLGCRAIRFCLERPDIFKVQLRAILRASEIGNVRMMFPMISGVSELKQAKDVLEVCKTELRVEGVAFNEELEVGIMIEVPSAALVADSLAKEVDFFSIGTNDLIQYTIAVDRVNERIAHLYQPTHPAILRLIELTVSAAHANGIWVGVCGEMAGEISLTPLLLGLGVDELSASAGLVPRVKKAVQSLDISECLQLIEGIKGLNSATAILARCEEVARKHYPELLN